MSLELLSLVGEALRGARWHQPLARDLGVAGVTMRRWLNGTSPLPADLTDRLRGTIRRRRRLLTEAMRRLRSDTRS